MEARYLTDLQWRICHAVNIYVFRNGRDGEQPVLVHIPPSKKKNMRAVMGVIQDRVKYPVGYAKFLYKMDGTRIRDPCELEMYNNYVVSSNFDKRFKCAAYGRKRSPLLVLNRDSKHVRVLKLQNQNYYEWLLKKKIVGEERAPYIYPAYYTNENYRAQDLPMGNMGNYQPPEVHAPGCCYPKVEGGKGDKTFRIGGNSQYTVNTVTVDAAPNVGKMMMDAPPMGKRPSGLGKDKHQKHPGQKLGGKVMLEQTPSDMLNANIVNISTETSQEGFSLKASDTEAPVKFGIEQEQAPHQLHLRKMKAPVQIKASTSDEYHEKHGDTSGSTQSLDARKHEKKSKWAKKSKRKKKSKGPSISLPMLPLPPPEFRDMSNSVPEIQFAQPYMLAQYTGRNHELQRQNVFMGYTPSCQRAFYYCPEKLADINPSPAGSFHQYGLTFINPLQQTHPFGQLHF